MSKKEKQVRNLKLTNRKRYRLKIKQKTQQVKSL